MQVGCAARLREVDETQDGSELRVPLPSYEMPDVPKRSAGYHASPGMDLVDLFVGSEGTLGVVTEIELKTLEPAPELLSVLIPCPSEAVAIGFGVIDAKSGSVETSLASAPTPGAIGPLQPSDSLTTAHARLSSNGTLDVWSRLRQVAASSPTRSGR